MSSPRAATSVATRRSALPARNSCITRSRCRCSMPPCSACTRRPPAFNASATVSTSMRVRQNTIADFGCSSSSTRPSVAGLLPARRDEGRLPHERQRSSGRLLASEHDAARILEMTLRNRGDSRRHRRREERRLARRRRLAQNRLEIVGKPHVEHFVRFIEHERDERLELERRAPQMIERAAGRRHDDVGAAAERMDLIAHGRAAVQRHDRQAQTRGVLADGVRHLHRELAGRHEHHPARQAASPLGGVRGESIEHRQRERRCFSGARCGLREQVVPLEEQGNRLSLNRRRLFVAEPRNGLDERLAQRERRETGLGILVHHFPFTKKGLDGFAAEPSTTRASRLPARF